MNQVIKKLYFSVILLVGLAFSALAQEHHAEAETKKFNMSEMIKHHIADSHEWHFATIGHTHISLSLPCIVYSKQGGFQVFSSSNFKNEHHELVPYNGLVLEHEKIHAQDGSKVYDFSITKNVAQLFLSAILLLLVFFAVSKGYKENAGKAPKGIQSMFEPIIEYVRDEIARPRKTRLLLTCQTVSDCECSQSRASRVCDAHNRVHTRRISARIIHFIGRFFHVSNCCIERKIRRTVLHQLMTCDITRIASRRQNGLFAPKSCLYEPGCPYHKHGQRGFDCTHNYLRFGG